ncbi:PREDICTED: myosin heavy chain kinase B-like [Nelumbo nucifera]|uniref:Myosin heavy chain kinase B-like n=1 Tax=Nelumbo nucifera TaxID=4432 RepID=A0A1U7ZE47_NELNU|nr:PREDICTED: myosin heavy chain kinase B-like [Nelumbo nucifera]
MDFHAAKKSLGTFFDDDEEQKPIQSPTHLSFVAPHHHQQQSAAGHQYDPQLSPERLSSASLVHIAPPSPVSPWTLSPIHTPSPSLLYHCVASLHRHEGNIFSIAVLKGLVFTGSESSRIRVWRQPDYVEREFVKTSCGEVRAILAFGNTLFSAHRDHKIRVWNVSISDSFSCKKVATLPRRSAFLLFPRTNAQQHKDCISCLAYYHAEGLLYTGSWDKTVKAWRVSDKRCIDSFVAHEDNVNAIVINQEDGCVFTCSSDGSIKIWRRVFGETAHTLTMTLRFQPSPVNALALSCSQNENDCFLYSGSSDGFINVWEKEKVSGRFNHGGYLHGHRFAVLSLVAIDKLVFSGSEDTTIRVWRREEGCCFHACLAVLDGHRGPVRCLAATLAMEKAVMGFLVYSASLDRTFKVWRVKVFPQETKVVNLEDTEKPDHHNKTKLMEYEMFPVLSPSWVEKKRQGNHLR